MSKAIHLSIDAMSGDFGPRVALCASHRALQKFNNLQLTLYIDRQFSVSDPPERMRIVRCDDVVAMAEAPAAALRHKRRSSMAQSLKAVAEGGSDGAVSAGNTGALVALARHFLRVFDGLGNPAICRQMPSGRESFMLDLGANTQTSAEQLHRFAQMGSALCGLLTGVESPQVALLNIGSESGKGPSAIQAAQALIEQNPKLNYCGYIEADRILMGDAQVIVCDGFAGNIALKACEGTARYIAQMLGKDIAAGSLGWLRKFLLAPVWRRWRSQLQPSRYNGAALLGLDGLVVKSHGGADEAAFLSAIEMAYHLAESDMVPNLKQILKHPE